MKQLYEKFLDDQEQKYMDDIERVLKENKGMDLLPLEKSPLDMVLAYVKEITTIHHMRRMIRIVEEK